jgi:hypothetical protein
MNVILNPSQGDTKRGDITLPANSNLTDKENLLWKIVNRNGSPAFDLPGAVTDIACFVGASGDVQGNQVAAEAPSMDQNCRILLDLTCNPGDKLALSPNIWGRVYAPQTGAGATLVEFVAEEAGIAGQLLLCRRIPARLVTF